MSAATNELAQQLRADPELQRTVKASFGKGLYIVALAIRSGDKIITGIVEMPYQTDSGALVIGLQTGGDLNEPEAKTRRDMWRRLATADDKDLPPLREKPLEANKNRSDRNRWR